MFKHLQPDHYYANIFDVNLHRLKKDGIVGIICDIDNTIVPWHKKEVLKEVTEWFDEVKERGFKICLLSNSLESRASFFSKQLDIPAIGKAIKPKKKAFRLARDKLELEKEEIAVIGDQVFTDIFGGNRLGFTTILVDPMEKKEFIGTRFLRILEHLVYNRDSQEKEGLK